MIELFFEYYNFELVQFVGIDILHIKIINQRITISYYFMSTVGRPIQVILT